MAFDDNYEELDQRKEKIYLFISCKKWGLSQLNKSHVSRL